MGTVTPSPHSGQVVAPEHRPAEQLRLSDETVVTLRVIERERGGEAAPGERSGLAARDMQGRTVGHVFYRRVYGARAEVAIAVDGRYWHRGLPELLLAGLCVHAGAAGISTLLVRAPASDGRLLTLLRERFAARERSAGAYVEFELATALQANRPGGDLGSSPRVGDAVATDGEPAARCDADVRQSEKEHDHDPRVL